MLMIGEDELLKPHGFLILLNRHSWLCWRPAPSSARCQCRLMGCSSIIEFGHCPKVNLLLLLMYSLSWWPLRKIMHLGLVAPGPSSSARLKLRGWRWIGTPVYFLNTIAVTSYQLPGPQYHCCYVVYFLSLLNTKINFNKYLSFHSLFLWLVLNLHFPGPHLTWIGTIFENKCFSMGEQVWFTPGLRNVLL